MISEIPEISELYLNELKPETGIAYCNPIDGSFVNDAFGNPFQVSNVKIYNKQWIVIPSKPVLEKDCVLNGWAVPDRSDFYVSFERTFNCSSVSVEGEKLDKLYGYKRWIYRRVNVQSEILKFYELTGDFRPPKNGELYIDVRDVVTCCYEETKLSYIIIEPNAKKSENLTHLNVFRCPKAFEFYQGENDELRFSVVDINKPSWIVTPSSDDLINIMSNYRKMIISYQREQIRSICIDDYCKRLSL